MHKKLKLSTIFKMQFCGMSKSVLHGFNQMMFHYKAFNCFTSVWTTFHSFPPHLFSHNTDSI